MSAVGIIPSRWSATRFPGKPLAVISGKPMIQRVVERVQKAKKIEKIIVATDDNRIFECINSLNKKNVDVVITKQNHKTGTDRISEIAKNISDEIIINIQGDEPLIDPSLIDNLVTKLEDNKWDMVTAATPIINKEDLDNSNIVKVVFDKNNTALYFSRSKIPYFNKGYEKLNNQLAWKHIGIYGYQKDCLFKFVSTPQSDLEKLEKLEQLRALHIGYKINVVETISCCVGVDTPEDILKIEKIIKEKSIL